jgi:small subunit ribosomal protein S6
MPLYESVFIARQDISATQVEALAAKLTGIITEQGGTVTKNEYWGLKNLAYRIKKNRKGHYTLLNIDAPAAAIKEMERNMRIDEDVLRYLTVKVEELEEGPSAMLRSREDRGRRFGDERDDRGDRFSRGDRGDRGDRGGRGEWRDLLSAADLAVYDARVAQLVDPELAAWAHGGRLAAGIDPDG